MDAPLISIIIPLYNHSQYIEDLIDSIRLDNYGNKECVVIDDCSDDNSFEVCKKKLETSGLKYLLKRNEVNKGVARTLNDLVESVKGEYIVPIASDDVLIPGSIESRLRMFALNPNADLIVGDASLIDDKGTLLSTDYLKGYLNANNPRKTTSKIIRNWPLPGPVFMYKKKMLSGGSPYTDDLKQEDFDFFLKYACRVEVEYYDNPVAKYRVKKTQKSVAQKITLVSEQIRVCGKQLTKCQRYMFSILYRFIYLSASLLLLSIRKFVSN